MQHERERRPCRPVQMLKSGLWAWDGKQVKQLPCVRSAQRRGLLAQHPHVGSFALIDFVKLWTMCQAQVWSILLPSGSFKNSLARRSARKLIQFAVNLNLVVIIDRDRAQF